MPVSEYKGSSSDSGSFEYKFPFRSNNNKWQRTSSSPQQSLTASPQPHTPNRAISLGSSVGKTLSAERLERGAAIPRSVSSDGRPLDTKRLEPLGFLKMDYWNIIFLLRGRYKRLSKNWKNSIISNEFFFLPCEKIHILPLTLLK